MLLKRVSPLFILFLFSTNYLFSQNCNLKLFGSIRDASNNQILPGAFIKIAGSSQTLLAEDDGHYHLNDLCKGVVKLEISYIGFETLIKEINITKDKEIDFKLSAVANELNDVEITSIKRTDKPLIAQIILKERPLQLTRGSSLGESLKKIPGLNSVQTGPSISKPVIHGLYANRVVIYNSGVRLEGQQWGNDHAPELDPFIANSITVVKGAASVQYGADALGGVILVEPAPLSFDKKFNGEINLVGSTNNRQGIFSGRVEGSTKNQQFAWRLQTTLKGAGNAQTSNYFLDNTAFNEFNGSFNAGYKHKNFDTEFYFSSFNTKIGVFSGSSIGSLTDLQNAIQRPQPLILGSASYSIGRPYQKVNHQLGKIKASYNFENIGKLNFQYSYQQDFREEYDVVRASSRSGYQLQLKINTQAADLFFTHNPVKNFSGKIGVSGMLQQNTYDGNYLIPFFKNTNGGAYLIETWTKNKFELEGGLRYDFRNQTARLRQNVVDNNSPEIRPEFNYNQLSATFGAGYLVSNQVKITTSVAKAWRPPAINELFIQGIHQSNATYEQGNRNLEEESGVNLGLGIAKTAGKFTGDLSFYYNNINNFIYLKPSQNLQLTTRGAFRRLDYVQVDARFFGADALATYQFNKFFGASAKYTTVRAYNRDTDQFLELIPADRLSGSVSFTLPKLGVFNNTILDFTADFTDKQHRVNPNVEILAPPAAYTLFNVDASSNIKIKDKTIGVSISGQNLLNKSYRDYLNSFRYFNDDLGRNITFRIQIPI